MSAAGKISDGFHTFDELYEHRHALYLALCRNIAAQDGRGRVWRAQLHADGTRYAEWFVLGIDRAPGEQITYHLPMYLWADAAFAETLDRAPEWDGHAPADVLTRIGLLR